MKKYCVMKIGRGIQGGYYEDVNDAVNELTRIVDKLLSQGYYQIHHEGEGRYTFVVLASKVGNVMSVENVMSVAAYQILEIVI